MVGNKFLTLLSNICTNLNLTDMETCYKAFRLSAVGDLQICEDRFGFEPEITARLAASKCRIYEVGISYDGRTYEEGKKIGWKDGFRAIYAILKYNFFAPEPTAPRAAGPRDSGSTHSVRTRAFLPLIAHSAACIVLGCIFLWHGASQVVTVGKFGPAAPFHTTNLYLNFLVGGSRRIGASPPSPSGASGEGGGGRDLSRSKRFRYASRLPRGLLRLAEAGKVSADRPR